MGKNKERASGNNQFLYFHVRKVGDFVQRGNTIVTIIVHALSCNVSDRLGSHQSIMVLFV